MSKPLGYDLRIDAGFQKQAGMSMPEIMKPYGKAQHMALPLFRTAFNITISLFYVQQHCPRVFLFYLSSYRHLDGFTEV
jgi:hypothetical protein